jgi:hypothetical protein
MLLGLLLSGILALPITMIQAITNQTIGLNVVSELIAGYLFEGKPVANMIFKGIGVIVCGQAASFSGDMKLGHYMKVPPRIMFTAQNRQCWRTFQISVCQVRKAAILVSVRTLLQLPLLFGEVSDLVGSSALVQCMFILL